MNLHNRTIKAIIDFTFDDGIANEFPVKAGEVMRLDEANGFQDEADCEGLKQHVNAFVVVKYGYFYDPGDLVYRIYKDVDTDDFASTVELVDVELIVDALNGGSHD